VSLDVRNSRFLRAVESIRWYRGRPEQLWTSVQEHKGTLLLELAKGLRVTQGRTSRGITKPHRFRQTTRALCYNLADKQHLAALLTTFSRMTAMAAALEKHPAKYGMDYLQRKVLSKASLHGSWETLELACENANYREPSHNIFAWNPRIRAIAWAKRRRQCWPKKQYTFYIKRGSSVANECSELAVPLECVARLAKTLESLLREVWSYTIRHQNQVTRRYDHPERVRWQLHRAPAFDWLMPRLDSALAYREEAALFEQPDLYKPTPRLLHPTSTPTIEDYHPRYLRRLLAYADGELLWRRNWGVSELGALDDLVHINKLLSAQVKRKLWEVVLAALILLTLRRRRKKCPSNLRAPLRLTDCWSVTHQVHHPPRGPPA